MRTIILLAILLLCGTAVGQGAFVPWTFTPHPDFGPYIPLGDEGPHIFPRVDASYNAQNGTLILTAILRIIPIDTTIPSHHGQSTGYYWAVLDNDLGTSYSAFNEPLVYGLDPAQGPGTPGAIYYDSQIFGGQIFASTAYPTSPMPFVFGGVQQGTISGLVLTEPWQYGSTAVAVSVDLSLVDVVVGIQYVSIPSGPVTYSAQVHIFGTLNSETCGSGWAFWTVDVEVDIP